MPIKSSGTLSFATDIVGEFEDTTPHSLSEFYRAGGIVPDAGVNANVPTANEIKFSDFYGATNVVEVSISSNSYIDPTDGVTVVPLPMGTTLNLFNLASVFSTPNPVTGAMEVPFVFSIDANSIFNNSIIVGGEFSDLTIDNDGVIAGRGGHGYPLSELAPTKTHYGATANDNTGNAAILIDYDVALLEVINRASAVIAGGGNGGTAPNSANTFAAFSGYDNFPNPSEYVDTYGDGYAGGAGGWNGGIGGYGAAATFAVAYGTNDDGSQNFGDFRYGPASTSTRTDKSYFGTPYPTLTPVYVTNRNSSGTSGHAGQDTVRISSKASSGSGSISAPSISSPTIPSGGTALNGGAYGKARAKSIYSFSGNAHSASTAEGVGGSGGGSGIGSGTGPVNVASSGQTGAGAGHSIEVSSGVSVTTGSFTNNGRRYGDTDVTIV